jgi:hypothetical protein
MIKSSSRACLVGSGTWTSPSIRVKTITIALKRRAAANSQSEDKSDIAERQEVLIFKFNTNDGPF